MEAMELDFDVFRTRLAQALGSKPLYGKWLDDAGINKGTMNSIMTRKAIPKVELLARIALELGTTIEWLIGIDTAVTAEGLAPPEKPSAEHRPDIQRAIQIALPCLESQISCWTRLESGTRAKLVSLAIDAVFSGKEDSDLNSFIGELNAIIAKPLPEDEERLLKIYRASSDGRKMLMLVPPRDMGDEMLRSESAN